MKDNNQSRSISHDARAVHRLRLAGAGHYLMSHSQQMPDSHGKRRYATKAATYGLERTVFLIRDPYLIPAPLLKRLNIFTPEHARIIHQDVEMILTAGDLVGQLLAAFQDRSLSGSVMGEV